MKTAAPLTRHPHQPSRRLGRDVRHRRAMLPVLLLLIASLPLVTATAAAADDPWPPPPPPKTGENIDVEVKTAPGPDGERRVVLVKRKYHKDGEGEPVVKWIGTKGAFLGVHLTDLTPELRRHFGVPEEAGVMIGKVVDASPAMSAGLQVGDIVTAVDKAPVEGAWDLQRSIVEKEAGDVVQLEVWRDGNVQTIEATLDERERPKLELGRMEMLIPEMSGAMVDKLAPYLEGKSAEEATRHAREAFEQAQKGLHEKYKLSVPFDEETLEQIMQQLEKALQASGLQEQLLEQSEQQEKKIERKMEELERKLRELERKLEHEGGE